MSATTIVSLKQKGQPSSNRCGAVAFLLEDYEKAKPNSVGVRHVRALVYTGSKEPRHAFRFAHNQRKGFVRALKKTAKKIWVYKMTHQEGNHFQRTSVLK